ncbi:ribonuclease catalytic domain-containing protein [Verminephrobacter eiseniae]|uniref:ribonuclease catalytic domain-containing protein n=1 Tax=Verminephrobacter eiseniae TaxID=364317 RepID=UPI002237D1A6|nr:RNB domain-containing ribonuclease [Verminephrobacter eiseniae]MCW5229998.1 RNB domain-containing ribonuclease [Verminephrobacter eiseniae]MCW5291730.1 RNB domain-containing ribonuclease [Verminephrobacter eiseniae]MCW8183381.1 RNB domain-containing ribonuclease [Verminephrobacter eiseniae]MCW8221648.1 RNB domain-containing ribonuclease [Verminephrobacter eiseniae]MCW8233502.1 RNB domain-containing ribonuclease [Verminephrobacter eiseniae]
MHALFEEAGKFMAGRILSEAGGSAHVELDSGKRVKVKAASVLLQFEQPAPAELLAQARAVAESIELDLAWEFAPDDEFGFADLARDYFSAKATLAQQAGALLCLYDAPHYFRRAGKGRFRKATADILRQALAAIEKKKAVQQQIGDWAAALGRAECPPEIREQLYKILFKPDKNAPEYKAVVQASCATHRAPLDLLQKAGAIDSAYQFHYKRFLFEHFPKGTGFAAVPAMAAMTDALPLSSAQAYSIDDSQTTEIDDALSLQGLGTGSVVLGIHIAAPGLAIAPGSAIDQIGRARLSTVYMPGHKITMLPDEVVQACTLDAGRASPAVSLYISIDEATLEFKDSETRLDRVHIAANLRHDQLDTVVTEAWLTDPGFQHPQTPQCVSGLRAELSFLYRLAKHLKARRELVRGKPENFNRPDYLFRLLGKRGAEPGGNEQVQISVRQRAAPLDLIVAEAMIVANSSWGRWMAELGVPGIYRSQASMAPGVKVRMGTKALPHAGIGVAAYSWATSPLRRYTDLVNQWQIIACARNGKMAALAAPFKPRDVELLSIITRFDAAYSAYNGHQASMERFWTLKYLAQNGIAEINATVIKEGQGGSPLVRADELPLVFPVLGAQQLPRGARLKVRLGAIDEITLDLHGTVLERLDDPAQRSDDGPLAEAEDAQDETPVAGPIAIAVQVDEPDIDPGPDPGLSASGREDR